MKMKSTIALTLIVTILLLSTVLSSVTLGGHPDKGPDKPGPDPVSAPDTPAPAQPSRDINSPNNPNDDVFYSLVATPLSFVGHALASARRIAVFWSLDTCLVEAARLNRTGNLFLYTCIRGLLP